MTETTARTYECPSPDCEFATGGTAELAQHVNNEHPGEFSRPDWPDTPAGRAGRRDQSDDDEEGDDLDG